MCKTKQRESQDRVNTVGRDPPPEGEYAFMVHSSDNSGMIDVSVGGVNLSVLMDSGATTNIISEETWELLKVKRIKCRSNANPSCEELYAYATDKPLPVKGTFWIEVQAGKKKTHAEFIVIKGKGASLLGKETAVKLGVLAVGIGVAAVANTNPALNLTQQYPEVFNGIGKLRNREITLEIDPQVKPIAQPYRRVPFNLRNKVEEKIGELIQKDIIESVECATPWVNPVVIIPKKESDTRLCVDMRQANQASIRRRYPIPTVDEILQTINMNGSKVFSNLDLKNGYHQLELNPSSREITTFVTHQGLYRYKRLLFGVNSASEQYQHEISTVLAGIEGADNTSDDIVVHGPDKETHDIRLQRTLERLRDSGLNRNPEKCQFNMNRLIFMGMLLSEKGIGPTEERVKSILREPKTIAEETHKHRAEEYVRLVAMNATPKALTTREIEEAPAADEELAERFENCKAYIPVTGELCVIGHVILRGTRIIIPNKFRSRTLALAHEGHLGIVGTKQNLRRPGMDKAAERHCKSCHGCQFVARPDHPEPLWPTALPYGPWQDLAIDLMGPLPSGHSLFVVVDYYSRFYEIEVMKTTAVEKIIDILEEIFSRHGVPLTIKSDNGPQFRSEKFKEYCEHNGIRHQKVTPKWAQANGEVERQNASLLKRVKIAQAEGKLWRAELRKYLMAYRSLPHKITGKSSAELLFNRKMKGKIPDLNIQNIHDQEVRDRDAEKKAAEKVYMDTRRGATYSKIEVGDQVLLRKDKKNKLSTTFSPNPLTVVSKSENNVVVEGASGNQYSRNTSHVKKYILPETPLESSDEIESLVDTNEPPTLLLHSPPRKDMQTISTVPLQSKPRLDDQVSTTPMIQQRPK